MFQVLAKPVEIHIVMSPLRLFRQPLRPAAAMPLGTTRMAVCPPALTLSLPEAPARWRRWLPWASAAAAAYPVGSLPAARSEFDAALADIATQHAEFLRHRIGRTRSMRELWHLRLEIFGLIAVQHSEAEAAQRLALLNRHFPSRAPGSGFMPLNG
jgi:hypothetical protein